MNFWIIIRKLNIIKINREKNKLFFLNYYLFLYNFWIEIFIIYIIHDSYCLIKLIKFYFIIF